MNRWCIRVWVTYCSNEKFIRKKLETGNLLVISIVSTSCWLTSILRAWVHISYNRRKKNWIVNVFLFYNSNWMKVRVWINSDRSNDSKKNRITFYFFGMNVSVNGFNVFKSDRNLVQKYSWLHKCLCNDIRFWYYNRTEFFIWLDFFRFCFVFKENFVQKWMRFEKKTYWKRNFISLFRWHEYNFILNSLVICCT